jgi:hypothetical protein
MEIGKVGSVAFREDAWASELCSYIQLDGVGI